MIKRVFPVESVSQLTDGICRDDEYGDVHSQQSLPAVVSIHVPEYFDRKAIWMRLLACALLVLLSPVMLLLVLAVRATSPGPALFRQKRLGRNGREFTL